MLLETDPYVAVTVRKLVMVSLMEVFKDIVPSYRIRPLTEAEKTTKVHTHTHTHTHTCDFHDIACQNVNTDSTSTCTHAVTHTQGFLIVCVCVVVTCR